MKLLREELEQTKQESVQDEERPAQMVSTHLGTWNCKHDGAHRHPFQVHTTVLQELMINEV